MGKFDSAWIKYAGLFVAGVAAVPLVVVVTALLGFWSADAMSDPPQWEVAIASRALQASIESEAPVVKSPFPGDTATIMAGMKVYQGACAGCHGLAKARSLYGLAAYPRVPQFGRQPPHLTDYQAYWVVKNGLRYSAMAGFHGQMTDADMWRVAEFVSRLRDLPPPTDHAWKALKMQ